MFRTHLIAKLVLPLALLSFGCPGNTKTPASGKPKNSASTPLTPGATEKDGKIVLGGGSSGSSGGSGSPTDTPGASGGSAGVPAREVAKASVVKFKRALDDYNDAKKSGKLNDKCVKLAEGFEDAFKEDPGLIEGLFNAGAVYMECGKTTEAEAYYDRVLAKKPGYARALSSKGYLRYKEGKIAEAQKYFEDSVNSGELEGQVEGRINLASLLVEKFFSVPDASKRDGTLMVDALNHLRRAMAIDSVNIKAYAALAMLYYRLGNYGLSDTICKQAIKDRAILGDYAPVYHILGLAAIQQKKVTQALQFFGDGLQKDPNYIPSLMDMGAISIRFRDYTTAKDSFARVVALDPKNFDAQISLGVAFRGLEDYNSAEKAYLKARDLNPKHPASYFNLGTLFQDYKIDRPEYAKDPSKRFEDAKKHYLAFKEKAGTSKEWEALVKDADKRITVCDTLIRAIKPTASATP